MKSAARLVVVQVRLPADYGRLDDFRRVVAGDGVGGLLVFGGDRERLPGFLRAIREAAPHPLLVMSDVERGVGQQVAGCSDHPPPMALGAVGDEKAARHMGFRTGAECREVGFDVALAPVLDLAVEPRNPIVGPRAFGADPALVARLGAAWIRGCQGTGVLACAKHFPGHGRTLLDSHDALPVVDAPADVLRREDLEPFRAAVAAGVGTVMTAHVAYPGLDPAGGRDLPATLSPRIVRDLLRGEMGYGGLVMTDALLMEGVRRRGEGEAAVESLLAGCDVLLCPTDHREVVDAVDRALRSGRLPGDVLDAAGARLDAALTRGRTAFPPETGPEPGEIAWRAVVVFRERAGLLPVRGPVLAPGARTLVLVLDDDDRPGREAPVRAEAGRRGWEVLRVTEKEAGDPAVLDRAAAAGGVLAFLYGDLRAWKGRPGLGPALEALRRALEERCRDRAVLVAFGGPALLGDPGPGTAVCAWHDAPFLQEAVLVHLLGGGVPGGRVP